jgi:hypothetical protein
MSMMSIANVKMHLLLLNTGGHGFQPCRKP